jgi:hypothetical protein
MKLKYTNKQVARTALPDAEKFNIMYLFKNVKRLRATYQILFLSEKAVDRKVRLIIKVPKECELDQFLKDLIAEHKKYVFLEDM